METKFKCLLLDREIDDSECYDIQMVIEKLIKAEILKNEIDIVQAETLCSKCEFNQLPRGFENK